VDLDSLLQLLLLLLRQLAVTHVIAGPSRKALGPSLAQATPDDIA